MSTGARIPYAEAMAAAAMFIANVGWCCEQIEIAGSLRRHATNPKRPANATVGDIEIVAIPKMHGLNTNHLWQRMEWLKYKLWEGRYQTTGKTFVRSGPKYRKYAIPAPQQERNWRDVPHYPCDIWLADSNNYGYILALRTGPDTFNKRFVAPARYGGMKPADITLQDGRVWLHTPAVTEGKIEWCVPEEINFFNALGIEWVPPYLRGTADVVPVTYDDTEVAAAEVAA